MRHEESTPYWSARNRTFAGEEVAATEVMVRMQELQVQVANLW